MIKSKKDIKFWLLNLDISENAKLFGEILSDVSNSEGTKIIVGNMDYFTKKYTQSSTSSEGDTETISIDQLWVRFLVQTDVKAPDNVGKKKITSA